MIEMKGNAACSLWVAKTNEKTIFHNLDELIYCFTVVGLLVAMKFLFFRPPVIIVICQYVWNLVLAVCSLLWVIHDCMHCSTNCESICAFDMLHFFSTSELTTEAIEMLKSNYLKRHVLWLIAAVLSVIEIHCNRAHFIW